VIECKYYHSSSGIRSSLISQFSICLAVSKSWRRLLESSPKLWTTLDTTCAKRIVSLLSLRAYLKRSNYTLDTAVISKGFIIDKSRLLYLTKHCKKLRHLEIRGNSMIGASLISSLPFAENLESIILSKNTIIGVSSAQDVLKSCRKTLTEVKFLSVKGSRMAGSGSWPILPRLRSLCLKADGNFLLDMVSLFISNITLLNFLQSGRANFLVITKKDSNSGCALYFRNFT
jgi:F-box/TPR repeat protein Pof3